MGICGRIRHVAKTLTEKIREVMGEPFRAHTAQPLRVRGRNEEEEMRSLLAVTVFLICSLLCSPVLAEEPDSPQRWSVDTEHSFIGFRIRHIAGHIPGVFSRFSVQMDFNPDAPEKGQFYFLVDSASVHTGLPARDEHLRGAEFLDAANAPRIIFNSKEVLPGQDGNLTVVGDLTIKDVTAEVRVPVQILGIREHPMTDRMPNTRVLGLLAEFSINRLDFHVGTEKWSQMGLMGDTIDLTVDMELLQRG